MVEESDGVICFFLVLVQCRKQGIERNFVSNVACLGVVFFKCQNHVDSLATLFEWDKRILIFNTDDKFLLSAASERRRSSSGSSIEQVEKLEPQVAEPSLILPTEVVVTQQVQVQKADPVLTPYGKICNLTAA